MKKVNNIFNNIPNRDNFSDFQGGSWSLFLCLVGFFNLYEL